MEPIRIGVVEDDPTASRLVLTYLKRYHDEYGTTFVTSTFKDGADIVEGYFPAYDILLMDIEMTGMDGMQAAREIRRQDTHVVIVFITAAPQYAISGYEVQALSYLLKPVPWFAFSQELKRSIAALQRRSADSVLVEAGSNRLRLTFSEIVYAESIRHTIVIHTFGRYHLHVRHAQGTRNAMAGPQPLPVQLLLPGQPAPCECSGGPRMRDVHR